MNYLLIFITSLALISLVGILRNILEDTYTWQIKEYRYDRIWAYLRFDKSKKFRGKFYNLVRLVALVLVVVFFYIPLNIFLIIPIIVLFLEVTHAIDSINQIIKRKIARPKIKSIRNILIIIISLCVIVFCILNMIGFINMVFLFESDKFVSLVSLDSFLITEQSDVSEYYQESLRIIPPTTVLLFIWTGIILLLDLLTPVIVALTVTLTWPLALLKRYRTIRTAKKKLEQFPKLKIIGITGSSGKTSTKEILFDILSAKYKVLMTPGNYNTTIGIAETILTELDSKHKVFIVEMGAYTNGEIRRSAELTPPHIALITNIGKSHIAMFGSVDNILQSKTEIFTGLRSRGIAIINADSEKLYDYSTKLDKPKLFFSNKDTHPDTLPKDSKETSINIKNIEWKENNVKFDLIHKKETVRISTTVVGRHQLQNLHSAITIAIQLKFTPKEIKELLKTKTLQSSHFKTFERKDGTIIIDDAYNSNPDGFNAAIDYLESYAKHKKIIITRGLQEVGSEIGDIYRDIAEKIIDDSDKLITTDKTLAKYINDYDDNFDCEFFEAEVEMNKEIGSVLKMNKDKNLVVLAEGRLSGETMGVLRG